ncbi:MAG TPA: peptidase M16, partial [Alphaproteobacteria bacterium]|nr:peptidase M16 [Alphaproteobacteria bacterium]
MLFLSSHPASARPWVEPETFTLDNGLQVVVLPDHRVPVVTHMVWYRVGAADEPPGKSGIAHFLEHLMFKGTDKIAPGEFSKIVARMGGQDNAFTSQDYTAYFQRIALAQLPKVMAMEADRMANLKLSEDVVGPERDVVLEERSARTDNEPTALFSEQMRAAQYLAHPYG